MVGLKKNFISDILRYLTFLYAKFYSITIRSWVDIPQKKERRRIVLLTSFLLLYTLILIAGALITTPRASSLGMILWISAAALSVVYFISRTRYYRLSIILCLVVTAFPVLFNLWHASDIQDPIESVMWLTYPILVCTLFGSVRMALTSTFSYLSLLIVIVLLRGLPLRILDSAIPFIISLACFSIAIISLRRVEQSEAEHEAQQRVLTQQKMDSQERYFRSLIDSFSSGVVIIDEQTSRIKDINLATAGLFSTCRKNVLGKFLSTFISIPDNDVDAIIGNRRLHGLVEGNISNSDTQPTPVLLNFTSIHTETSSFVFVGINDITEKKRIEEREKRLQHELMMNSHLTSLGQMAAGLAHEINNPLAMLTLYVDDMTDSGLSAEHKQDIDIIHQQINRISNIVSGMLKFSRNDDAAHRKFNVNTLISETLGLRTHEHKTNNIEVHCDIDTSLPHIFTHRTQLQQVLLNVIVNAEKELIEAHSGGIIVIKTGHDQENIEIRISDNGRGISEGHIDRIFEPFFSDREFGEGTGLGLSICYNIMNDMGGSIQAKNNEDCGTTFSIKIPLSLTVSSDTDQEAVISIPYEV